MNDIEVVVYEATRADDWLTEAALAGALETDFVSNMLDATSDSTAQRILELALESVNFERIELQIQEEFADTSASLCMEGE